MTADACWGLRHRNSDLCLLSILLSLRGREIQAKSLCSQLPVKYPGDGAEVGPASTTIVLDYIVFVAKTIVELERKGESLVPERVSVVE